MYIIGTFRYKENLPNTHLECVDINKLKLTET